jgi:alkyldihydroxyacetonephosphate synthase
LSLVMPMLDGATLESLARIVGPHNVLQDPYDLDRYSADALNPFRAFGAEDAFDRLADVVVRPGSTEEVSQVVVLANQQGIPLVPYGSGTGVMGAALPVRGGITVELKRLNRILSINQLDMTAEVEAGVVLQDLVDALAQVGLMPGHDPYSVPIASVAGTISTNGVGYRAAAFGPMGKQVVSLEVVLPTGEVLSTRPVPKYSSGPNLNHLFIGSEGALGIITRATVRVFRKPEASAFVSAAFENFDQGFEAAAELLAIGMRPALLDVTEEDEGTTLFLLFEGFKEGVAAQEARWARVCAEFGGTQTGPGPAEDYWRYRHQSGENYKRTLLGRPRRDRWDRWGGGRGFDYLHMALPVSRVLEYRDRCKQIMAGTGVRVVEYCIWSRPELFSMMLRSDGHTEDETRKRMAQVVDQVLTLAQDMGGVMEYCHGVGVKLNHLLARELGVGQDVVKEIKRSLDPANILNPGKLGL